MINNFATCIGTAHAWTWISTVLIETSQMTFAISIDDAFGFTTIQIRIANKWRYASTFSYAIDYCTNSIFAAR